MISALKKILLNVFHAIYWICREIYLRLRLIIQYIFKEHTFVEKSYYVEKTQKSKAEIFQDQIFHILRYGEINEFYYLYGFDIKGCQYMDDFIDYRSFFDTRNKRNLSSNYLCILRDKILFWMFLESYGVTTPKLLGFTYNGLIFNFETKSYMTIHDFIKKDDLDVFVKIIDGECGKGVFNLTYRKSDNILRLNEEIIGEADLINIIGNRKYIIQEKAYQHHLINNLYSKSINTIRLVTYRDGKTQEITVLPSVFRIGCNDSLVDNWSKGGISVGIDIKNGTLKKYGFFRPEIAKRVERHPNTGIILDGYRIPFFDIAVEKAVFLHSQIPGINSIGWDIAISEKGPVFIEGNDNWEVSLNQACNIESAEIFKKLFKN